MRSRGYINVLTELERSTAFVVTCHIYTVH